MSPAESSINYEIAPKRRQESSYGVKKPARKVNEHSSLVAENRLARSPKTDEFQRSSKRDRTIVPYSRDFDYEVKRPSGKPKKAVAKSYPDASKMTLDRERANRARLRAKRKRQRKIQMLKRRCAMGAAGILGGSVLLVGGKALLNSNKLEGKVIDTRGAAVEDREDYDSYGKKDFACDDTEFVYDIENNVVYVGEKPNDDYITVKTEEELIDEAKQAQIDEVNKILEENPDVKQAFYDIEIALRRASIEYGGNIIELLEEMNDKFGLNQLPLELQACVLEQESTGFFTNWKTHEVVVNGDGDTGWYQLTDTAEADFDRIAKWLVKKGVSEQDIEEIKKRGRSDMRGNAGHGAMILSYLNYRYDDDIDKLLSAYNAGEGSVAKGYVGEKYIQECYKEHLEPISRYEVLLDYIFDRDYYEAEEDGVPHVYVNETDGSVRYPD